MTAAEFRLALDAGTAHLLAVPELAPVVRAVGPCTLGVEPNLFRCLVRAMVAQLISVAAARTITTRVEAAMGGRVTPAGFLRLTDEQLAACGVSGAKRRAMRELAEHFRANPGFAARVTSADDAGLRALLLPLRGVGPWTVDMAMMFGLGRLDVLPVGDLGLRAAARDLYGLPDLPAPAGLTALAEPWRPYRTVGTWYLWRSRGWTGTWTATAPPPAAAVPAPAPPAAPAPRRRAAPAPRRAARP